MLLQMLETQSRNRGSKLIPDLCKEDIEYSVKTLIREISYKPVANIDR